MSCGDQSQHIHGFQDLPIPFSECLRQKEHLFWPDACATARTHRRPFPRHSGRSDPRRGARGARATGGSEGMKPRAEPAEPGGERRRSESRGRPQGADQGRDPVSAPSGRNTARNSEQNTGKNIDERRHTPTVQRPLKRARTPRQHCKNTAIADEAGQRANMVRSAIPRAAELL